MANCIKIAIANRKGGIGKTTTALSLAANLQKRGYRVLFIDTDAQRNSSVIYHAEIEGQSTMADILYSDEPVTDFIQKTNYGDIVASDPQLETADSKVEPGFSMYYHLKDALEPYEKDYDYMIFDTPPHSGVVLGNVLMTAKYIVIPVTCDPFGVQGVIDFYKTVQDYRRGNPEIKVLGLLNIKYKGRESLTRDIEDKTQPKIAERLNTKVFKTRIRESVKCREAQAMRVFLEDYAPSCTTARDYYDFTSELIEEVE